MSVENTTTKVIYNGNGMTTEWPVPFPYSKTEDIRLLLTEANGAETEITENFRVNVTDNGDTSVTYPLSGRPIKAGVKLTVYRDTPRTQIVDLIYGGAFSPDVLESDGFDRAVMMIQEIQEEVDRAVKVPISSSETPEALAASLFNAKDKAEVAAKEAAKSAGEAKSFAARTAEIKAAALREVREESEAALNKVRDTGDFQAARLDDLAAGHILTFEREVERAHNEADRAEDAANRAERTAALAQGVGNLEAVWTLERDVSAGEELALPIAYFAGRHALRLSWGGVQLYQNDQYEEIGEPDSVSQRVRVLFDLPAGARMNAWAVASNVARGVEDAEEAARKAAQDARDAALAGERLAEIAGERADRAREEAGLAARSAWEARNAAGDAARSADRSEKGANKAEDSAKKAQDAAALSGQGRLFTLKNMDLLENAPQGFYIIDKTLLPPALAALPLTSVEKLEDLPNADCYVILGGTVPETPEKPGGEGEGEGGGSGSGPDEPGSGEGGDDGKGRDSCSSALHECPVCGKR